MKITDPRFPYVPANSTNIRRTLTANGFVPPEQNAEQSEHEARLEGALRAMKRIQSLPPRATVTSLVDRRRKS